MAAGESYPDLPGWTSADGAPARHLDHLARFHDLLDDCERGRIDQEKLGALETMDGILPRVDYTLDGS